MSSLQPFLSILAGAVSLVMVAVAYLNFRLNKTLNIKNQIFNEKLKIYREISRKIAESIFYLTQGEVTLREHLNDGQHSETLIEMSKKIDSDADELQAMMIEAFMLAPKQVLDLMEKFVDKVHLAEPSFVGVQDVLGDYIQKVEETRLFGEKLIESFRADLNVEKLTRTLS